MESAADCKFKTKMDKRSGFWQVDLTERAKDMMAFITPQGRVFKWRVMYFGISNAPALFQEVMSQVLCLVKKRPTVQELLTRGAVLEAHIDDVLRFGIGLKKKPVFSNRFAKNNRLFRLLPLQIISFSRLFCKK